MSKAFKILISLIVICLSSVAFFACTNNPTQSTSEPESVVQSMPESEESVEESEEDPESNFEVELPEVDRM